MALWEARRACPELVVLPPRFDRYIHFTREVQKIYAGYTDRREPFGLDESWLDLTGCVAVRDGESAAQEIRRRVKRELGLTVSVGVSWNKVFAKLGSDYKKPDAVTVISRENYKELVWPMPAEELLFVGRATSRRLRELGIATIGDLAQADGELLRLRLGKPGLDLHESAAGRENSPVRRAGESPPPKSVGNGTTPPRDMRSRADALPVLTSLAEGVGRRLRSFGLLAGNITLELRSDALEWRSHGVQLPHPTDCDMEILAAALELLDESHRWPNALRSVAIRAGELCQATLPEQMDVFTDYAGRDAQRRLDGAIDRLRARFGRESVLRGAVFADRAMAAPPDQEEYSFVRKLA